MCSILLEYGFSPSIPRPLQNILSHQPKLPKGIFHDYLTKRQLPKVGLLNPLLQIVAGIGFIRNVPQRLQNRQRFGSTKLYYTNTLAPQLSWLTDCSYLLFL